MRAIAIGTSKGGYLLGEGLGVENGPLFPGWKVSAWGSAPDGTTLAALASNWFGTSIQRSDDLEQWSATPSGPTYGEARPLNQIWALHTCDDGTMLAGVDEAGLFRSTDAGETWGPVPALNDWPGRDRWFPGLGGLCAHHIVTNGDRWWVGISAVGVFRSDDSGETFTKVDAGIIPAGEPETGDEPAMCVHSIVGTPDRPDVIWRQDHTGVYRTVDAGAHWERIEEGLPSRFGFPIRRDTASGHLFVVPMESDENRVSAGGLFRVFRSADGGATWHVSGAGWSDRPSFDTVLRGAMATDGEGMIVVGTTGGNLWISRDAGDAWEELDVQLPRILSVEILA